MRSLKRSKDGRFHRVFLAWGKWWAFQAYLYPALSLGIHIDPRRPIIDIHFLIFTFSIGKFPILTNEMDRKRQSCRGFLFITDPVL